MIDVYAADAVPPLDDVNRQLLNFIDVFELVGMNPVVVNPHRRGMYDEHMGKYDFSSLSFPVHLQAIGPFALRNNMSINVYGVDDDKELIYLLRVSSTLVPDRHVDLLLFEHDGVQHYTTIRNISRLIGRQLRNHGHTVHCCRRCLDAYSSQELLDAHALDCCHAQRTKFPRTRAVDSPISRKTDSTVCSIR